MSNIIIDKTVLQQKEEIINLKGKLSDLYFDYDTILYNEIVNITHEYNNEFGDLLLQEYLFEGHLARLRRKIELAQQYINKQEPIDVIAIGIITHQDTISYANRMKEYMNEIMKSQEYMKSPLFSDDEVKELKSMYRIIVKQIHPDINQNLTEEEDHLFKKAESAYKNMNLIELRVIFQIVTRNINVDSLNTEDEFTQEINNLKKSISLMENKIEEIKNTTPYTLTKHIINENEKKKYREELALKIEELTSKVREYNSIIKDIEKENDVTLF